MSMTKDEREAIRDFAAGKVDIFARGWKQQDRYVPMMVDCNDGQRVAIEVHLGPDRGDGSCETAPDKDGAWAFQLRADVRALDAALTRVEAERDGFENECRMYKDELAQATLSHSNLTRELKEAYAELWDAGNSRAGQGYGRRKGNDTN